MGHGVEKDEIKAREWYKKAALQGEPQALYNAGRMCMLGEGGERDYKYAARMFRQLDQQSQTSLEVGERYCRAQAQNSLGVMYLKGAGVAQDHNRAAAWFIKSAENDLPEAQANLARCHRQGWGVERDLFEAGRFFYLAALQGDAQAQWDLGEMFRRGDLYFRVKMHLARKYIEMAAEQGHPEAVERLEESRPDRLRCVFCGAGDAPSECGGCHRVRYCNIECSIAHWGHGGGFAFALGGAEEPHRHTCARTYM
jgi:TPR repeat protein